MNKYFKYLIPILIFLLIIILTSCQSKEIRELETKIILLEEENSKLKKELEERPVKEIIMEPAGEEIIEEELEEEPIKEVEPEPARKEYGPGMYIIEDDIEPGIYKSEGGITYFERLAGFSGELDDILANEAFPSGPIYVEIKSTDVAFNTEGSGKWYRIDLDEYKGDMLISFGDGYYIVGKDIIPGRYKSADGCDYWARLKDFSGELNSIIANSTFDQGTVIVEIQSTDFGFQTQGANWEKIAEEPAEELDTEEIAKTEEEKTTGKQENASTMQPLIDSATDSLGHIQTWSAAKDNLDNWPHPSPTIYIGDVITFTINVSNNSGLLYKFDYQPSGGCFTTIQDWSNLNVCTWTVPKEAFGKWIPVAVQVKNNDGLNFLGNCDDYANLTYTVLSK